MMPTARENLNLVNLRLPKAMIERVDELQALVSDAPELRILPSVTRSDVLRLIVLRGLEALEAQYEAVVDQGLIEVAEERAAAGGKLVPLSEAKARLRR
jgi:hypothetical protein